MVVDLIHGTTHVPQNTKIHLTKSTVYRSSKTIKSCRGKWYYEATHYSGGSNYHLVGYSMDIGGIYFYPRASISQPKFYMSIPLSHTGTDATNIPFSVASEHTIGLGIDVDKHLFYVFYNNNYAYYDYIKTGECQDLRAVIWGANSELADDNVSVNFGDRPFLYDIPGFTPWAKMPKRLTCNCKRKLSNRNVCILLILFAEK